MTGLFYLGVAVTGVLAFLIVRPRLFAVDDPGATLANLTAHDALARADVALELWGVGALFFGLWLIPMGWCVLRSGWIPRVLGWTLVGGGVGYVLNAFVRYLAPDAQVLAELVALPAHIGEFWMVGYLLVRGARGRAPDAAPPDAPVPAAQTVPPQR